MALHYPGQPCKRSNHTKIKSTSFHWRKGCSLWIGDRDVVCGRVKINVTAETNYFKLPCLEITYDVMIGRHTLIPYLVKEVHVGLIGMYIKGLKLRTQRAQARFSNVQHWSEFEEVYQVIAPILTAILCHFVMKKTVYTKWSKKPFFFRNSLSQNGWQTRRFRSGKVR